MGLRLNGSTSGYVELQAPAVAGSTVLELPLLLIKPALVLITTQSFTAASTVSLDSVFTSDYDNYRFVLRMQSSGSHTPTWRLRAAGVDDSGATNYYNSTNGATGGSGSSFSISSTSIGSADTTFMVSEVSGPALAAQTTCITITNQTSGFQGTDLYQTARTSTVYDGLTVIPSAGTITGTISVYGYTK